MVNYVMIMPKDELGFVCPLAFVMVFGVLFWLLLCSLCVVVFVVCCWRCYMITTEMVSCFDSSRLLLARYGLSPVISQKRASLLKKEDRKTVHLLCLKWFSCTLFLAPFSPRIWSFPLTLCISACSSVNVPVNLLGNTSQEGALFMSTEENKALIRRGMG